VVNVGCMVHPPLAPFVLTCLFRKQPLFGASMHMSDYSAPKLYAFVLGYASAIAASQFPMVEI